ncbi:tetratricopeptide repeat protein [Roseateles sp. BYS87W]|uniref:Tetratricopeptide repeat protein n=1 Tax=Pelomonas baiyunensis TaxID=3299026 RepID=A0ABW7H4C7_9BURK
MHTHRLLRRLLGLLPWLLGGLGLGGCATPPSTGAVAQPPVGVFLDAAFRPPRAPIDASAALALSPAMERFAETEMAAEIRRKGVRDGLIDALYSRAQLQLDYDSDITRTAAEAFEARRGNCMSLVLMTAAFARHLGLPFRFNSVYTEDSWTRANGIYFVAGHVNITLSRALSTRAQTLFGEPDYLTIDFLPPDQARGLRSRVIEESTLLAMYLNNRAAEALGRGEVDEAYWWAREAIRSDARWHAAYNTLAVLYRRKGLQERAESTLQWVLAREPANVQALSNLMLVLNDAGRKAEADVIGRQLAQLQPVPPYKYFDEGLAAMRAGQYAAARQLFRQELDRAAYVPEFHFWLALANFGLGDVSAARSAIAKALENSATTKDREVYSAKLAWLNDLRDQQQRSRSLLRGSAGS